MNIYKTGNNGYSVAYNIFLSATRQSKQFVSKQMNAFDTHALFVCNNDKQKPQSCKQKSQFFFN